MPGDDYSIGIESDIVFVDDEGPEQEYCGATYSDPHMGGEEHVCWEPYGHDDNHVCCDFGIWTQDGVKVVSNNPTVSDFLMEADTPQEEENWEDGLYA